MIHLQMAQGKNNAQKAANYLLSKKDHSGKTRSVEPEVLDGDPHMVAEIANNTTRQKKYVSGTLAFRDTEKPTLKQQQEIIRDFEQTFMPGLVKDKNYAIAWVAHWDKGNLELNYLMALTELETGKQLNPFPPDSIYYEMNDAWVQNMNERLDYDQVVPDPFKIQRSKFEAKILPLKDQASAICKQANSHKQIRDDLQELFQEAIVSGQFNSRDDVITELKCLGTMTRIGEDYLSFIPVGEEKAIRLKGPMFHKDADYKQMREDFQNKEKKKELTPSQFQKNQEKIDRLRTIRGNQFKKQYQQQEKKARRFGPKSMQAKKPVQSAHDQPQQKQSEKATTEDERQLQDDNIPLPIKDMLIAKQQGEAEEAKNEKSQIKKDQKNEEAVIQAEQHTAKKPSNKSSKPSKPEKESSRPDITSLDQIATGSRAAFFTIQINHVLVSKHSLEMQIGRLSIYKESDIKKIFLLKQEIARLDQQIAMLKAQQEQAAEAELIQQQAARYKNNLSKPKPAWV